MEGRTYEDADWEYDRALYEWIYRYNAYERLGCSREQAIAPLQRALDETGTIPVSAGIDALKGWAFTLARHHYWEECEGGLLIDCHPELELILTAIRDHPAVGTEDLPPFRGDAAISWRKQPDPPEREVKTPDLTVYGLVGAARMHDNTHVKLADLAEHAADTMASQGWIKLGAYDWGYKETLWFWPTKLEKDESVQIRSMTIFTGTLGLNTTSDGPIPGLAGCLIITQESGKTEAVVVVAQTPREQ